MRFWSPLFVSLACLVACADPDGEDAGTTVDAAPVADTGPADTGVDAGPGDTGADTGPTDSGTFDVEPTDAPPADVTEADADPLDAALADAAEDAGPGDGAEVDTGPADTGVPACGDGVVQAPETCDPAIDLCCNSTCDGVLALDTACRAGSSCDLAETCDGVSAACPTDALAPDWTSCVGCTGTSSTSCLGCYAGTCAPYVSPCLAILQAGLSTGDGIYDIPESQTATTALPVFCDMTTDGGGWTMVYKKSAAVAGNSATLWESAGVNGQNRSLLNRARATADYASPLISRIWPAFTEARVEVLTASIAAQFITCDATGSTTTNWFGPTRWTASSWTDLPTDPNWEVNAGSTGRYFSIRAANVRAWYVNNNWGGCSADTGWLIVDHYNFCSWEGRSSDAPTEIFFSTLTTRANQSNTTLTHRADALGVFAR